MSGDLTHRASFVTPELEPPTAARGALCAQTDPESFFPEKGGSTRDAKATCMGCPIRESCLEWALETQERFGVWGGMSERERRKVLRDRAEEAGQTISPDLELDELDELDDLEVAA